MANYDDHEGDVMNNKTLEERVAALERQAEINRTNINLLIELLNEIVNKISSAAAQCQKCRAYRSQEVNARGMWKTKYTEQLRIVPRYAGGGLKAMDKQCRCCAWKGIATAF